MISPSAKKVIISVNPKAGRTSPMLRAEELRDRLNQAGCEAEVATDLDVVTDKARRWHSAGELRALVGVGGDGTAAELVNRTEPLTPFAIMAAGNANLIAKYYRIGKTPKRLAKLILDGNTISLDAGRANGRLFLVMIGCGFDAEVVQRVHANREESYKKGEKKGAHVTNLSYMKPIFQAMRHYSYPPIQSWKITEDGEKQPLPDASWVFVFNLNTYGWGLPLVPDANGQDGKLDHCLLSGSSVFAGAWHISTAQLGSLHRFLPGVSLGQSEKYHLESEKPVPYQLDGDPGGLLPVDIEIVKNRCQLIVPLRSKANSS